MQNTFDDNLEKLERQLLPLVEVSFPKVANFPPNYKSAADYQMILESEKKVVPFCKDLKLGRRDSIR